MRLRSAIVSTAILALAASGALAQNPPCGGGGGQRREGFAARRAQMLFKDITLTPEQQAKVDSIRARYRSEMPVFAPGMPPDSATRQKVRELFRRQNYDIRAVLTADQQKLWDRNVAEMQARRLGGP